MLYFHFYILCIQGYFHPTLSYLPVNEVT